MQDLYGSLVQVNRTTRICEYVVKPSARIIHISLNDRLVHSWADDFHALQAVDVPISADTSAALPELARLCRQVFKKERSAAKLISSRFKAIKEHHDPLKKKWSSAALQIHTDAISLDFLTPETACAGGCCLGTPVIL